jgi:hypothetical protein
VSGAFDPTAFLAELDTRPRSTLATEGSPPKLVYEDDAQRIADLPWVDYDDAKILAVAHAWATNKWSRGPDAPMQFREIQALALLVAHLQGGAFLPIGTGWGKTLIALCAADALGARKPLLFIPPALRVPFDNARIEYNKSFKVPGNLRTMAYSQLSVATSTDVLSKLAPDVIVGDEAHNLRHLDAARTKRLVRYLKANPYTKCVFMSGTLTSKSLRDYAHLCEWSLKNGSPVPLPKHFPVLQAFCNILDAKPTKKSGGDRYVADAGSSDFALFSPLFPDWREYDVGSADIYTGDPDCNPRVDRARAVFQDRLTHAKGVVATSTASVGASLLLIERPLDVPDAIKEHLADLEATWRRPDGEEIVLALDKWRCGRQITQGFYYRWKWPDDEPDLEWLFARATWHREVRRVIGLNRAHLDSPMLVTLAARRALAGEDTLVSGDGVLLEALREWEPHAKKRWGRGRTPPTETVWIDDYLLDDAAVWAEEHPLGLLWYGDNAVAGRLAERGLKVYGAGTNPEDIAGRFGAALSIHVHKDGKNLQKHSENLVLNFDPSGTAMEQLISRTHRSGQESDEVSLWWYGHTEPARNAVASAKNDARYIQETMRTPQRLCYGTWLTYAQPYGISVWSGRHPAGRT